MNLVRNAIQILITIMYYAIFARILLSWLPISRDNPLVNIIYQITEPILAPIRTLIQKSSFGGNMMFDFSPLIAILILMVLQRAI